MRNAIVVGGGLAGITAALALQDSGGWNVKLFEARKHLGGRVSSIRDPDTGLELDNCQHACFRVYDHFLQLIARCSAEKSIKF
ncbi:MAG: FAD-dependent oxidoreductase, partial [Candidatus Thermoplasmatota archaeon]|nr:FAD-dependent oxidoreductase [Candidatus Thermoplasmatota archaeon]